MPRSTVTIFALLLLTIPAQAAAPPPGTATMKPPPECASAKTATECADILRRLGKNPFDAFDYPDPVYAVQNQTPLPPCTNGAPACKPWERDWSNTPLPPGSIVTDQGIILPLQRSPFETFLYNWQTLITGGLAIIAAIIGASAAYHVGSAQMAAAKRKDRLQAQCIAVAISPELLNLKVRYERASKIIGEEFPKAKRPGMMTDGVVALIRDAQIEIPPLLNRSLDQLYILDEAGPTLLQLISVVLQYNDLVTTLASQIRQHIDRFNPPEHQKDLSGHLKVIAQNIADAERLIAPLHDEATAR
jgi:hypothetical protein